MTATKERCVTRTVPAWPPYVSIPVSDSVIKLEFPISNVTLPCGHIEKKFRGEFEVILLGMIGNIRHFSHFLDDLKYVKCQKMGLKKLPYCEHSKQVACFASRTPPPLFAMNRVDNRWTIVPRNAGEDVGIIRS